MEYIGGRYFVWNSVTMVRLYINWTNVLFGWVQTKISDQGQTCNIISPVSWSCDETWSQLKLTSRSSTSQWMVEIMIIEGTWLWLGLVSIQLSAGNKQVLPSVDTWWCNAHDYCLREARWLINHIFDMQRSLHFFSYILMTPPWNVCVHLR